MGWSLSWIALKNCSQQQASELFGLTATGETEDSPEHKLTGTELSSGYYLLAFQGNWPNEAQFTQASSKFDMIRGCVEEHVMFSDVAHWTSGRLVWSVEYAGENGPVNKFQIKGEAPAQFEAIRQAQHKLHQEDEEEDHYFEVPILLAERLIGYRYDAVQPIRVFSVFVSPATFQQAKPKGFLARLKKLFS